MDDETNSEDQSESGDNGEQNPEEDTFAESVYREFGDEYTDEQEKKPKPHLYIRAFRYFFRARRLRKQRSQDSKWLEKTLAILTVALLGLQALIYFTQTQLMKDSLGQNRDSLILNRGQLIVSSRNAATAISTLESSQQQFRNENRPYMIVRPPDIPDMSQFGMRGTGFVKSSMENIGHSIAFKTRMLPVVDIIDRDTKDLIIHSFEDLTKPIDQAFKKDVIDRMEREERHGFNHPLRDMAPGQPSEIGAPLGREVSVRNMLGIIGGNSFAIFMGTIHFTAFDNEDHVTEFCWFMTNPIRIPPTEPNKSPTYNYNWILCKDHNTIH